MGEPGQPRAWVLIQVEGVPEVWEDVVDPQKD
jgi:hypothetical protein